MFSFFELEYVLIRKELKRFIREINAELFKSVSLVDLFKSKNVQNADSIRFRIVCDAVLGLVRRVEG